MQIFPLEGHWGYGNWKNEVDNWYGWWIIWMNEIFWRELNRSFCFADDGIFCFADHGFWLNMQGSVNHYLHHSKFNWNYGSRWKIGTCLLISSPIRVYLLGWVKKSTIHACNTTCRYLMPFFSPARCGITWWGQTTLGVRAAARGRIMQSSRWESRMVGRWLWS